MFRIPPVPLQGDTAAWATKTFAVGMIGVMLTFGVFMLFWAPLLSVVPTPYVPRQ